VPPKIRIRRGFDFSSALVFERTPRPSAPPAAAETLMKFRRVVDVMRSGSMIGVKAECNRQEIMWQRHRLLIVFD
jgi:hypothetical protein